MRTKIKYENADRLVRDGARTGPVGLQPFFPLPLSGYKSEIKSWAKRRKWLNGEPVVGTVIVNNIRKDKPIGESSS